MSGLAAAAVIGPRGRAGGELARIAAAMARELLHRGPASGSFADDHASLVALGGGVAARGALRAVADARLDRRADLAGRLGLRAAEHSDAELLLAGWERWGDAVVLHAEGDFAAAIWDAGRRELVLLRDALGVRPLYLARRDDVVLVASETHALAASGSVDVRSLDRREAARYLVEDYAEEGPTIVAGVEVAQPGGVTRCGARHVARRRVWCPDAFARVEPADPASCAERLREVLGDAVRARIPSEGRASVLVSGGVDSSSVACLLARETAAPPDLLHLAFPGSPCDEAPHLAAVASATGGKVVEVDPRDRPEATSPLAPRGPGELYEATLSILEPLFDAAALPRGGVVLTGVGGDDLLHPTGHECVDALRAGRVGAAVHEVLAWTRAPRAVARTLARQAARAFTPPWLQAAARRRLRTAAGVWPAWLTDDARDELHRWHLERMDRRAQVAAPGEVQRRLVLLLTGDSDLFVLLARLDRFAARRGIDLRHPFYDRRVVELLLATPPPQRARGTEVKGVLREAMRGTLPEPVRTRRDAADFTPWIRESLDGPHRAAYRAAFSESALERSGIVRPGALLRLLDRRGDPVPLVRAMGLEAAVRSSPPPASPKSVRTGFASAG